MFWAWMAVLQDRAVEAGALQTVAGGAGIASWPLSSAVTVGVQVPVATDVPARGGCNTLPRLCRKQHGDALAERAQTGCSGASGASCKGGTDGMLAADIDGGDGGGRGRAGHIPVPAEWDSSPQRRVQGDVCPRAGRYLPVGQGRADCIAIAACGHGRKSIEAAAAAVTADMAPVMAMLVAWVLVAGMLVAWVLSGWASMIGLAWAGGTLLVGAEAGGGRVQYPGRSARQSGSRECG